MSEAARVLQETEPSAPPPTQKRPWNRMEGEPALWYRRLHIYIDLGYKRSLEAAVLKEQSSIKVLKSTKDAPLPKPTAKKGRKVSEKRGQLVEVPKPRPVQVPGSWRAASVKWDWVARARAWDTWCIDQMTEKTLQQALDGLASKTQRIQSLKRMAEVVEAELNEREGMRYETFDLLLSRLQSIMRDIRVEMLTFDEAAGRAYLRQHVRDTYTSLDAVEYETARTKGVALK